MNMYYWKNTKTKELYESNLCGTMQLVEDWLEDTRNEPLKHYAKDMHDSLFLEFMETHGDMRDSFLKLRRRFIRKMAYDIYFMVGLELLLDNDHYYERVDMPSERKEEDNVL